jgi:hypothetical protein
VLAVLFLRKSFGAILGFNFCLALLERAAYEKLEQQPELAAWWHEAHGRHSGDLSLKSFSATARDLAPMLATHGFRNAC